jgi:hypothetical protein
VTLPPVHHAQVASITWFLSNYQITPLFVWKIPNAKDSIQMDLVLNVKLVSVPHLVDVSVLTPLSQPFLIAESE